MQGNVSWYEENSMQGNVSWHEENSMQGNAMYHGMKETASSKL